MFFRILSRLTTKDDDAKANRTPLPPPGPFVTPILRQQLDGIQPKFAALYGQFMRDGKMEEDEPVEPEAVEETGEAPPVLKSGKIAEIGVLILIRRFSEVDESGEPQEGQPAPSSAADASPPVDESPAEATEQPAEEPMET